MSQILDYISFRGDIPFELSKINEVDRYIFTCFGKPDYSGLIEKEDCVLAREAVTDYILNNRETKKLGLLGSDKIIPCIKSAIDQKRYFDIKLACFENEISISDKEQFSALTVLPNDGKIYITFRGTDDTFVGWEENCLMASDIKILARERAIEYIERVANIYPGKIVLLGHSKGGNIAIYAGCNVKEEVRDRIELIESYDGPGFLPEFISSNEYNLMKDRITTLVSENSIVGMIMDMAGKMKICKTSEKGISAHDALSWEVEKDGFSVCDSLSKKSIVLKEALKETLLGLSYDERRTIVAEIFKAIYDTKTNTLTEFTEKKLKNSLKVASNFSKEKEVKRFLSLAIKEYLKKSIEIR